MRKNVGTILGIGLAVASIMVATVTYRFVHFWLSIPNPTGRLHTIYFEVHSNENVMSVAQELEKRGVVSNARSFYWYVRLSGKSKKFKAGDYRFTNKMRPSQVAAIIMSGISYGRPFVVPEGYNMRQIAEALDELRPGIKDRFLHLCRDRVFIATLGLGPPPPRTLEGYLFPDTYLIERKTAPEEIVRAMVRKFKGVFTQELLDRARAIGMSVHQVVTLASIIEKETGASQERPLISSVFHNRLRKRMKLQSDPTVIYGVKNYNGDITRHDLETYSPYNTYRIKGLPPGPIASPGRDAIMAALYPAETDYLYFVSRNDGTHEFTTNYADHRKAVMKFQLDPRRREGHSWRELTQKHGSNLSSPGASGSTVDRASR